MRSSVYLILIASAIVLLGTTIETTYAWVLNVEVTDKPFGEDRVLVMVKGADGWVHDRWYDFASIKTGPGTGIVSVNVPESAIPSGETYEACVSSNIILSILPSCKYFAHGSGDESISMSLS